MLQQQQPRGRARRLTAVAGRYVLPGAEEEEGAAAEAFAGWPVMRLDEPAVQKAAPTGGAQEGQQPGGDSARKMGSAEPPEDEQRAALKIQARHRGAKTREKLKQEKEEREEFHGAALKIQARHRGAKTREKLKLEKEEREEFHGAALKIQARHRGAKTREKLAREARARLAQEDGAVARLQGWFRRTVTRLRVEATRNELLAEQLRATCRIQSWWYRALQRRRIEATRRALVAEQEAATSARKIQARALRGRARGEPPVLSKAVLSALGGWVRQVQGPWGAARAPAAGIASDSGSDPGSEAGEGGQRRSGAAAEWGHVTRALRAGAWARGAGAEGGGGDARRAEEAAPRPTDSLICARRFTIKDPQIKEALGALDEGWQDLGRDIGRRREQIREQARLRALAALGRAPRDALDASAQWAVSPILRGQADGAHPAPPLLVLSGHAASLTPY